MVPENASAFRSPLALPQAKEALRLALAAGRYEGTVGDGGEFQLEQRITWAPWKYSGKRDFFLTTGHLVSAGEGTDVHFETVPRRALLREYALVGAFYFAFSMMIGWNKVAQGDMFVGALFAASLLLVLVLPIVFLMRVEALRRRRFLKQALALGA